MLSPNGPRFLPPFRGTDRITMQVEKPFTVGIASSELVYTCRCKGRLNVDIGLDVDDRNPAERPRLEEVRHLLRLIARSKAGRTVALVPAALSALANIEGIGKLASFITHYWRSIFLEIGRPIARWLGFNPFEGINLIYAVVFPLLLAGLWHEARLQKEEYSRGILVGVLAGAAIGWSVSGWTANPIEIATLLIATIAVYCFLKTAPLMFEHGGRITTPVYASMFSSILCTILALYISISTGIVGIVGPAVLFMIAGGMSRERMLYISLAMIALVSLSLGYDFVAEFTSGRNSAPVR